MYTVRNKLREEWQVKLGQECGTAALFLQAVEKIGLFECCGLHALLYVDGCRASCARRCHRDLLLTKENEIMGGRLWANSWTFER